MTRATTTLTAAAISACLAVPATGRAQATQTQQPPAAPQTAQTEPAAAQPDTAAAREHLSKARAALNDVNTASLNARAKAQVAEIGRRLTTLEAATSPSAAAPATKAKAKAADAWGTEVAAIDKTLTTLLGPTGTTGTTGSGNPAAAGTSGTSQAKPSAPGSLDETSKAKLTEVRTHLTAFATTMAGGTAQTSAAEPAASTAATTPPATATPPAGSTAGATTPPAQPPQTPPAQTPPAQTPETPPQQTAAPQPNPQEARRHLTEARNALSELAQLPAAAQLTGEARTHVSQLISNFNELITSQTQWRPTFDKVNANLTALIGPPVPAGPTPPVGTSGVTGSTGTSGTPGTVGTSGAAGGMVDLDATIRGKLFEVRRSLIAFEAAAGGNSPSAEASAAPTAMNAAGATAGAGTTTPPQSGTASTAGTGATPQTAGTSGTATPPTQAETMQHVAAIDALLKMQDDSGGLTLTKTQVEQLRAHWAALRTLVVR